MGIPIVADVMTRNPVVAKPEMNLLDCAKQMVKGKVGSLLLVNEKKLVGILSEKDILWALTKRSQDQLVKIKAIDISPRKLATIRPSATLKDAMQKMNKYKFEKLPVIKAGELVGLITTRDILNFKPELYPELEEFASIREESEKLKRIQKASERNFVKEGMCEECGQLDLLYNVNGSLVCESCKEGI